jgi:nucleoid-associated protein YgaU
VIRAVPVNGEWTSSPTLRSASISAASAGAARAARTGTDTGAAPSRLRLTRRGRLVVGAFIVAGITAALLLITMLASGGAQATNHGQARAGYQGMHQVVVQSGQTLWSIATKAEPTADPRIVIGQIMAANALQGSDISAGQLLWVP